MARLHRIWEFFDDDVLVIGVPQPAPPIPPAPPVVIFGGRTRPPIRVRPKWMPMRTRGRTRGVTVARARIRPIAAVSAHGMSATRRVLRVARVQRVSGFGRSLCLASARAGLEAPPHWIVTGRARHRLLSRARAEQMTTAIIVARAEDIEPEESLMGDAVLSLIG